jgi:hypothetical protein
MSLYVEDNCINFRFESSTISRFTNDSRFDSDA